MTTDEKKWFVRRLCLAGILFLLMLVCIGALLYLLGRDNFRVLDADCDWDMKYENGALERRMEITLYNESDHNIVVAYAKITMNGETNLYGPHFDDGFDLPLNIPARSACTISDAFRFPVEEDLERKEGASLQEGKVYSSEELSEIFVDAELLPFCYSFISVDMELYTANEARTECSFGKG